MRRIYQNMRDGVRIFLSYTSENMKRRFYVFSSHNIQKVYVNNKRFLHIHKEYLEYPKECVQHIRPSRAFRYSQNVQAYIRNILEVFQYPHGIFVGNPQNILVLYGQLLFLKCASDTVFSAYMENAPLNKNSKVNSSLYSLYIGKLRNKMWGTRVDQNIL